MQSDLNEPKTLRRYLLAMVVAALVISAVAAPAYYFAGRPGGDSSKKMMVGSMFVSDAGRSHGGFEYTATWNATLEVSGNTGTLRLILNVGLGDALTNHQFAITDFATNSTNISMKIDGRPVTLVWIDDDRVWNGTYDHFYVASWGGDAPRNEVRGSISPVIFPGLMESWYVELRLH